jgi:hypothetical protein
VGSLPKMNNEFRFRLVGHEPSTGDNLLFEWKGGLTLVSCPPQERSEFFENYR